jgi:hypothetical protein
MGEFGYDEDPGMEAVQKDARYDAPSSYLGFITIYECSMSCR